MALQRRDQGRVGNNGLSRFPQTWSAASPDVPPPLAVTSLVRQRSPPGSRSGEAMRPARRIVADQQSTEKAARVRDLVRFLCDFARRAYLTGVKFSRCTRRRRTTRALPLAIRGHARVVVGVLPGSYLPKAPGGASRGEVRIRVREQHELGCAARWMERPRRSVRQRWRHAQQLCVPGHQLQGRVRAPPARWAVYWPNIVSSNRWTTASICVTSC
jgi:hypothetical protein